MSEKLNIKQKGETDVKQKVGTTILKTINVFDIENAGLARSGKGDWDDFQLMESSNKKEGEYSGSDIESQNPKVKEALKRAKRMSVGRKILAMKSLKMEVA